MRRLWWIMVGAALIPGAPAGALVPPGSRADTAGYALTHHRHSAVRKPAPAPTEDAVLPMPAAPPAGFHPAPGAEKLTNLTVVELTRAGLGDPAIIAKVYACEPQFDTASDVLIALRRAGVSSSVIAAMIAMQSAAAASQLRPDSADPHQPHPAGVYLLGDWLSPPSMLAVKPITTTRTTNGSILGYAIGGGLIPVSYRAIVPGGHAGIVAGSARPTFYFYTGAGTAAQNLRSVWGAAPDPGTMAMVRFAEHGDRREVRIGSFSIRGANTGVSDRDRLAFAASEVEPGVIAVRPEADLPPGEYGFVTTAAGVGIGAAQASTTSALVFDFAVDSGARASLAGASGRAAEAGGVPGQRAETVAVGATLGAALVAPPRRTTTRKAKPAKAPNSAPSLYP